MPRAALSMRVAESAAGTSAEPGVLDILAHVIPTSSMKSTDPDGLAVSYT